LTGAHITPEPAPPLTASLTVATLDGANATSMCDQSEEWTALHLACPWATTFQTPAFARVWYRAYAPRYTALLVTARRDGELVGLLPLAREQATGTVVPLGAQHAEYHTWLCRPEDAATIPAALLAALRPVMQGRLLRLLFLAPGTPMDWQPAAETSGLRVGVRWHRRGLLRVGPGSEVDASLRKSANKSRLSRLRRLGPVSLDQLHTRAELAALLPTIAEQCDVRQGGIHGVLPFTQDPLKREFYLGLMDEPDLAHATVLRAGEHVLAAHLSVRDPHGVPLGLITHAPQYAAHSPGKLVLLLLARLLGEQGYTTFDLTPGGSYKDRFATHGDQVALVDVFYSQQAYRTDVLRRAAIQAARRVAATTHVDLDTMAGRGRDLAARLRRAQPLALARSTTRRIGRWLRSDAEYRLYELPREEQRGGTGGRLRVNQLRDLLRYEAVAPSDPSRTAFLKTALDRLEDGQMVFTYADERRLLHYSWLIPAAERVGSEYGHTIETPDRPAVLWDDFTHPIARGQGLHQESLRTRLDVVRQLDPPRRAVIGVRAENAPSRHNIEKVGFRPFASAWIARRLGRARRWVTPAP
jgi:CelD/BcsL family acetyltransferase involved in cellulose biosynthesis/RimJ/RimL family protein N-acetyltransferase